MFGQAIPGKEVVLRVDKLTTRLSRLPVFQDKNLLVTITFYKNELDYEETMKMIDSKMNVDLKARLKDVITIKNIMILYPSEKL